MPPPPPLGHENEDAVFTVLPLIRTLCSRWYLILTRQQEARCSCSARSLNQLQPLSPGPACGLPPFRSCPRTRSSTPSAHGAARSRTSPPQHTPAPPAPLSGSRTLRLQEAPQPQSPPGLCREGRRASPLSEPEPRPPRAVCVRAPRQAAGVRSGQAPSSACDLLSGSSSSAGRSYGGGALSKRVLRGSCWKLFLPERGAAFSDLHPGS